MATWNLLVRRTDCLTKEYSRFGRSFSGTICMLRRSISAWMAGLFCVTPLCGQEPARWPQFRGIEASGVAREEKSLPIVLGPEKNLLWRVSLSSGVSSLCVWDERIFLTGHDEKADKLETLCLNRATGEVLWRRIAPAEKVDRVYKINSPASATPATDGERVYVSFGSYGLVCYDFAGKELWRRPLPRPPAR